VSRLFRQRQVSQSRKGAKHGRFFFVKKEVVVAFLCVFAPLREPHFQATAGLAKPQRRKARPFLLCQEEGRCCLSLRLCAFA
jgi:hypothetical protein